MKLVTLRDDKLGAHECDLESSYMGAAVACERTAQPNSCCAALFRWQLGCRACACAAAGSSVIGAIGGAAGPRDASF